MSAVGNEPEALIFSDKNFDSAKVVSDLFWLSAECDKRCLYECAHWANEQLYHLSSSHLDAFSKKSDCEIIGDGFDLEIKVRLTFCRSLIRNREYRRAKFFLGKINRSGSIVSQFLYYFSWYMIHVSNRVENEADDTERKAEFADDGNFYELRKEIEALKTESPEEFDCFLNYLLGLVRKDSEDNQQAFLAFKEAIDQDLRCWPAWHALSGVVDPLYLVRIQKDDNLRGCWIASLFTAETMFRLQLYLTSINVYTTIAKMALGPSPYLLCQIAAAQSEMQEHDSAISTFQKVRQQDPYRVEQMNFFSDSLYIRSTGHLDKLSSLAKFFYESHKYRWETCCIVANYYSARKCHELAQDFLRRAVKLVPSNASIWVLLGHEFMETKDHHSAAASYRKAIVIDPLCYRGWYGFGQLFEILKQPINALYAYQQAHKCRPADSRMLIALGVIFSKLQRISDAEKCFKKAFQVGDVEGNALIHLAKLYEGQSDYLNVAKAYEAYLSLYTEEMVGDLSLIAAACRFLARYYFDSDNLNLSYSYAQRCLNFETSKEEGMRILQRIRNYSQLQNQRTPTSDHRASTSSNASSSVLRFSDSPPSNGGSDILRPTNNSLSGVFSPPPSTSMMFSLGGNGDHQRAAQSSDHEPLI